MGRADKRQVEKAGHTGGGVRRAGQDRAGRAGGIRGRPGEVPKGVAMVVVVARPEGPKCPPPSV